MIYKCKFKVNKTLFPLITFILTNTNILIDIWQYILIEYSSNTSTLSSSMCLSWYQLSSTSQYRSTSHLLSQCCTKFLKFELFPESAIGFIDHHSNLSSEFVVQMLIELRCGIITNPVKSSLGWWQHPTLLFSIHVGLAWALMYAEHFARHFGDKSTSWTALLLRAPLYRLAVV